VIHLVANHFTNDWQQVLSEQFMQPYYKQLTLFLNQEYATVPVYPDQRDIFHALQLTAYADVKVVILGQDPYHGPGQAHGLSFSVKPGVPCPPSLVNIYKELCQDIGCPVPKHGHLAAWAKQGVLLLNAVLTVRDGSPQSHKGQGWEWFTDRIVEAINAREKPVAFILWGNHAQEKGARIDEQKHLVLRAPHPSPLSAHRGFFGSRPFSRVNAWLRYQGQAEIDWRIPDDPVVVGRSP
jgi:uracil-DNA glycosylase